jgi:uncharacterized protein (TIGR00369 family)
MTMQAVLSADPLNVFAQTPFMRLLGMQRDYSSGGKAQMSLEPNADLGNVIGAVHGGVVVTLLDVVMASAAVSIIDFAKTVVTLNLTTSFVEPGRGQLIAQGDQDVAWCTAQVRDAQGRLVAQAQASFRYLPRPV